MFDGTAENIAGVLALIVGVSLALSTALGPLVTYLVEAIKATGLVKDGYAGLVSVAVGMLLGVGLTALTDMLASEPYSLGVMVLLGAFVGAIVGAGGISQYKASGSINTKTDGDITSVKADPEIQEALTFVRDVKTQAMAEAQRMQEQERLKAELAHERDAMASRRGGVSAGAR